MIVRVIVVLALIAILAAAVMANRPPLDPPLSPSDRAEQFVTLNADCGDPLPGVCACRMSILRDSFGDDVAFMAAVDAASHAESEQATRLSVDFRGLVDSRFPDHQSYVRQVLRCAANSSWSR